MYDVIATPERPDDTVVSLVRRIRRLENLCTAQYYARLESGAYLYDRIRVLEDICGVLGE